MAKSITLKSCDLKIVTKTLSNRISKVIDEIIHESQTAYTQEVMFMII